MRCYRGHAFLNQHRGCIVYMPFSGACSHLLALANPWWNPPRDFIHASHTRHWSLSLCPISGPQLSLREAKLEGHIQFLVESRNHAPSVPKGKRSYWSRSVQIKLPWINPQVFLMSSWLCTFTQLYCTYSAPGTTAHCQVLQPTIKISRSGQPS